MPRLSPTPPEVTYVKKLTLTAVVLLLLSVSAWANIARPGDKGLSVPKPSPGKPKAPTETEGPMMDLQIQIDDRVSEPTLVVKRAALARLNSPQGESASTGGQGIDSGTVIGGAFLSLALVFGGVWAVRSNSRTGKIAGLVLVMAAVGGVTAVFADLAPPTPMPITQELFSPQLNGWAVAKGGVKVVVRDDERGPDFRLVVPRSKN